MTTEATRHQRDVMAALKRLSLTARTSRSAYGTRVFTKYGHELHVVNLALTSAGYEVKSIDGSNRTGPYLLVTRKKQEPENHDGTRNDQTHEQGSRTARSQ